MQFVAAVILLLMAPGATWAQPVPAPKERPAGPAKRATKPEQPKPAATPAVAPAQPLDMRDWPFGNAASGPSSCDRRLAEIAAFSPREGVVGPGECGMAEAVRLEAVRLPDGTRIPLNPPSTMLCPMAEAVAMFIRDELAPAAGELGSPLAAIVNFDSYECRGRNRVAGARVSEHGKGNAIDIKAVRLRNGSVIDLTEAASPKDFRDRIRTAACNRFNTVLGPGSDPYHENHIHLDLARRSRGYKMCQWDVREPPSAATVPLPLPRPAALAADKQP
jgi:hypothetical protein